MKCPKCAQENRKNAKFCKECATSLADRRCASCGAELDATAKFCDECSQPAATVAAAFVQRDPSDYTPRHLAVKILDFGGSVEGERKTITALFADIKGSMELMEDLDPEEARRLIDPALELMMDGVHRYEGYVAQSAGDGIVAMFGAPIAHEDHAQRALYAALLMQEKVTEYGEQLQRDKGIRLPIRVGINTGEVVVRSIRKDDLHTDYDPIGHSTGLAARMEALANPGTVLVSENTHRLAEGYFEFKDLGPAKIKGARDPVRVYEVEGVGPLRTRLELSASRGLV
ncbi:MAG: adenylate/guanylate cyclase domain-containing protein, partial [Planctomycetota bacterium]